MPVKFQTCPELGLTVIHYKGHFGIEHWRGLEATYFTAPSRLELNDMRLADFAGFDQAKMRIVVNSIRSLPEERRYGLGKSAFVTPSTLAFGLARMFALMAEANGVEREFQVFGELGPACRWLGVDEARIQEMIGACGKNAGGQRT